MNCIEWHWVALSHIRIILSFFSVKMDKMKKIFRSRQIIHMCRSISKKVSAKCLILKGFENFFQQVLSEKLKYKMLFSIKLWIFFILSIFTAMKLKVILSHIESHWVALSHIKIHWVTLSYIELHWVTFSHIESHW